VAKWEKALKAKWTYLCLGSSREKSFRRAINPTYKAHRGKIPRPQLRHSLATWVLENFKTIKWDTLEGDDVLGIMSTGPLLKKHGTPIIVSADKDMLQIPGLLWNPRHTERGVQEIDARRADYAFYKQVLMGDSTDGYTGIPGCGPKRAEKILSEAKDGEPCQFWQAIIAAYKKAGLDEEFALMQARMARILRWEDYDYENKEVRLWEPPK
jgi:DNA polymerase-1